MDQDTIHTIRLQQLHLDLLFTSRWDFFADVVGVDGEFPVTSVNQGHKLDLRCPPVILKTIESRSDSSTREDDVIN